LRAAVFLWLTGAAVSLRAEETNASGGSLGSNQPASPLTLTNAPSSIFPQNRPELFQTPPGAQTNLSLQQGAPLPNDYHELNPSGSGLSSQPFPFFNPFGQPEELADHLLVVYNANDPDSRNLAAYYAAKRKIPAERVLSISCPTSEEITRAQYSETIREPIISYICQKNWMTRRSEQVRFGNRMLELLMATRNDIWAIVLMRGVPLKIAPDPSDESGLEHEPELQTNAAAVDSELALLPIFGLPYGGYVPNAFFDSKGSGLVRAGPDLSTKIILVTRLDGPKPSDVRRMIDDSLYAEQNRLAGLAVIDSRGITDISSGYAEGDTWMRRARDLLTADGWFVKFDDKESLIPATDPCNHVAFYLGWYSENAEGPWITAPNRFVPGAIAYHLHSFSAGTVRSSTSNWVGPLIAHGAAAAMGTVYEPYLALTPHVDIFTKRLLEGNYFAEAAYASQMGLSWMVTVVGDPLYRPFRQPLNSAVSYTNTISSDHNDWLLLQQVQRSLGEGQILANTDTLENSLNLAGTGTVAEEGLGDLLEKLHEPSAGPAAEAAYKKAMALETAPMDRIRIGLKLAQHYINHVQDDQAQAELRMLRELYPRQALAFGVASSLMPTTTPPPTTTLPVRAPRPPKPPGPPQPQ